MIMLYMIISVHRGDLVGIFHSFNMGRENIEWTHWVPDFNMIRENGVGRESREQTRLVPDFNMIRENGVGRENGEQTHWVPDSNMIRENGVGRENGEQTHWVPAFFMGRGNWKWTRCVPAEPEASKRFENAFPKRQNTKKTWKQPKIKSHDQIEFDHELLIKKLLALQIATYEENCWKLFEQKGSPTADNDGAQCAEKGMLGYDDIPWPHEEGCDLRDVEDFLFGDREKGSMEYKTYLRQQQVRWHPDRFLSRCGDRLIDSHKQRIIGKVMELSQLLNRLIQEMQK